ncbi:Auxin-induced protein 5NG4 [Morus notabilis]|uniref:WAT1-related protein n=1 Tax=Morus notabilis TaxID=981085 RepID=W9RLY0_9ROSA|nr:Auxin-induced protein 5NG4 [Morus notabilis]
MVVVQFVFTGVNVLYKLAANDGMNLKVIVAYRLVFATAFILPLALFIERKSRRKLTWTILFQAFLCGLFGASLPQNLYLESLVLTSATLASAMTNLIPAITFFLAVIFRLEKLNFGTPGGKAKVLGSLLGVGGALILTFYKGVDINIWSTHVDLLHRDHQHNNMASSHDAAAGSGNHVLGCLLAVASSACFSVWFIIQAKMSEKYPCYYSSTALMSIMATIQTLIFALCTVRDWSQWKLGWNIRLLTVAYSIKDKRKYNSSLPEIKSTSLVLATYSSRRLEGFNTFENKKDTDIVPASSFPIPTLLLQRHGVATTPSLTVWALTRKSCHIGSARHTIAQWLLDQVDTFEALKHGTHCARETIPEEDQGGKQ